MMDGMKMIFNERWSGSMNYLCIVKKKNGTRNSYEKKIGPLYKL